MNPKQPPHAIESELCVIGGLMIDDTVSWEVFSSVSAEDFYRVEHKDYFTVLRCLHADKKPMDFVSVAQELMVRGLGQPDTFSVLGEIASNTASPGSAPHHAKVVREKSQARALIALAFDVAEKAYREPPAELVSFMSQQLSAANVATAVRAKRFSEVYDATEEAIMANRYRREQGHLLGAPTGIPELDAKLGGLVGPKLIVIAARPATGKTALLNLAGVNSARNGFGTILCSLEMSEDALMVRALSAEAGCNVTKLSLGFADEFEKGAKAYADIGDIPLWIDTDSYDLDAICAQIATHKHRHGIQLAAIDHIGLVNTRQKFNSRNDQMGHISRTFKQLAKRLNMPIIALSQLSRECEKQNRRPVMSDLRDSGNLEQDADIVLFLHTPYDKRNLPKKPLELGLAKNRGGRTGWITGLEFDGATQRIYSVQSNVVPFQDNRGHA